MVEQRTESRPLIPTCYFTHTAQVAQLAGPALGPGRGRLLDVLLGRSPSLHALRRCLLTVVRVLRRYFFDRPTPQRCACWTWGSRPSPTGPPHLPRRASLGSPGSRAWSFQACTGSRTAQSPAGTCVSAPADIAFRLVERRRHSGRDLFRSSIPDLLVPLSTLRW